MPDGSHFYNVSENRMNKDSRKKRENRFWENLSLDDLSDAQWESLCDKCGLCCLHRFEDNLSDELKYTNISCQFLKNNNGCSVYSDRDSVKGCLNLRAIPRHQYRWLPDTCAYKRLWKGEDIPDWHPLITGTAETISVYGHKIGSWSLSDKKIKPKLRDVIPLLDIIQFPEN